MAEFWLSEEQFARLAPLLPTDTRGVARVDDRRVISGIVHVLMSGGRWSDAPACYGPRKTLYNRWVRWARKGVWQRAFETLRAALNMAYRVKEGRSYLFCLMQSLFLVLMTAAGMLALAWGVVVGPVLAQSIDSEAVHWLLAQDSFSVVLRYAVVLCVTTAQLLTYHLFLTAGRRSFWDVWPGVMLSVVLWILLAQLYSRWLAISDYSRFYAGLTQLFTALIFFQVTAIVVILGAEFNRALSEVKANA